MWDWFRNARRRARVRREARQERKIVRWLKAHPDKIRIDERRLQEWSRKRD